MVTIRMDETAFLGLPCLSLDNGAIRILIPRSVGPRVLALFVGGHNLFAEVPDRTLECPGRGVFRLWGGHRLWHAPEIPQRTYLPDDAPVHITPRPDGVAVAAPIEEATRLQKILVLRFPGPEPRLVVDHILVNHNLWAVECAPWAITQLRPGGFAILPQPTDPVDPAGVWPNRRIALWPYTDVNSPFIRWGNRYLFVHAAMPEGRLKLGFPNRRGWLAYFYNGFVFVKHAPYDPGADYYDEGSSSECFCSPDFLELETLGPRMAIPPGGQVRHREVWSVWGPVSGHPDEDRVDEWVQAWRLEGSDVGLSGD